MRVFDRATISHPNKNDCQIWRMMLLVARQQVSRTYSWSAVPLSLIEGGLGLILFVLPSGKVKNRFGFDR
jgi:hypothetical protein